VGIEVGTVAVTVAATARVTGEGIAAWIEAATGPGTEEDSAGTGTPEACPAAAVSAVEVVVVTAARRPGETGWCSWQLAAFLVIHSFEPFPVVILTADAVRTEAALATGPRRVAGMTATAVEEEVVEVGAGRAMAAAFTALAEVAVEEGVEITAVGGRVAEEVCIGSLSWCCERLNF
jgi:hypothetical protein